MTQAGQGTWTLDRLCPCVRRGFGPVTSPLLASLPPPVK